MKHPITSRFLLLALLLPTTAFGYDFEVDGIYYNVNGNEATVTFCSAQYETGDGDEIYIYDIYSDYSGHVTIPDSVTYNGTTYHVTAIGDWAFICCDEMTSITIPNSITAIGNNAFFDCGLTGIDIPNSITSIGAQAFCSCENLTSINIPNSITEISFGTFTACHNLANVTIPNSVTVINDHAFHECTGLTSIDIPNSILSIGANSFFLCSNLARITVASDNLYYDSRNNCNAIIETATNTLFVGCKNTTIPSSVTKIGENAFIGCSNLLNITIPNSVTEIGEWAFNGCSSLIDVCSYIENPQKVSMGYGVFFLESEDYTSRTLHVPASSLAAYRADENWNMYFGNIVEMETVPTVLGDIDGDGKLTIQDVVALIDLLLTSGN